MIGARVASASMARSAVGVEPKYPSKNSQVEPNQRCKKHTLGFADCCRTINVVRYLPPVMNEFTIEAARAKRQYCSDLWPYRELF